MGNLFRFLIGLILLLLGGFFMYAAAADWIHSSNVWLAVRSCLASITLFAAGIMTIAKSPWRDIFDFIMHL